MLCFHSLSHKTQSTRTAPTRGRCTFLNQTTPERNQVIPSYSRSQQLSAKKNQRSHRAQPSYLRRLPRRPAAPRRVPAGAGAAVPCLRERPTPRAPPILLAASATRGRHGSALAASTVLSGLRRRVVLSGKDGAGLSKGLL